MDAQYSCTGDQRPITVFLQAFLYRWSVQPIKMHLFLASILKEWVITDSTFLLVSNHRVCLLPSHIWHEATTLFSFVLALPWSKQRVWVERSIIPQRCLFLKHTWRLKETDHCLLLSTPTARIHLPCLQAIDADTQRQWVKATIPWRGELRSCISGVPASLFPPISVHVWAKF